MGSCRVVSEIALDDIVIASRVWESADIMKLGITRAWTRRQFNAARKALQRDQILVARWDAFDGAPYHTHFKGSLSACNGRMHQRGIFEDY